MKVIRTVLALLISVLAVNTKAQEETNVISKKSPKISFTRTIHDFGTINEGDVVETTFTFKNTGNAPLLISKIKSSCGCTVPNGWKRTPILPGEESQFSVKFNTRNKPNKQSKRITITSNADKNYYVTIKAQVTPDPELQKAREERMKKYREKRAAEKLRKENSSVLSAESKRDSDNDKIRNDKRELNKAAALKKDYDNKQKKIEKDLKKVEKENKKLKKEIKKTDESIAKDLKKAEKENKIQEKKAKKAEKKADKERKSLEKATKKAEKKAKKIKKLTTKISKIEKEISKKESKIKKIQKKLERQTEDGELSPNDIAERKKEIAKKQKSIDKLKLKLLKRERKLEDLQ